MASLIDEDLKQAEVHLNCCANFLKHAFNETERPTVRQMLHVARQHWETLLNQVQRIRKHSGEPSNPVPSRMAMNVYWHEDATQLASKYSAVNLVARVMSVSDDRAIIALVDSDGNVKGWL